MLTDPSSAAVDYVSSRLLASYFNAADEPLRKEVRALREAAAHRHARPQSQPAQAFALTQLERARRLRAAHSYLELDAEVAHFQSLLSEDEDDGGHGDEGGARCTRHGGW